MTIDWFTPILSTVASEASLSLPVDGGGSWYISMDFLFLSPPRPMPKALPDFAFLAEADANGSVLPTMRCLDGVRVGADDRPVTPAVPPLFPPMPDRNLNNGDGGGGDGNDDDGSLSF